MITQDIDLDALHLQGAEVQSIQWALDLGYRFNSSTVGGEFVYAHEIKLGARYMF